MTTTKLESATEKLAAAGYEISSRSNDERLILAVTAEDNEDDAAATLDELRAIVGPGYSVEYTGDGNTDARGVSTDDVRIELAD